MAYIKLPRSLALKAAESSAFFKDESVRAGLEARLSNNLEVELDELVKDDLYLLVGLVQGKETPYANAIRFAYSTIAQSNGGKIGRLDEVLPVLKAYMTEKRIDGWVYTQGKHDALNAYAITDLRREERSRYRSTQAKEDVIIERMHCTLESPQESFTRNTFNVNANVLSRIFDKKGIKYTTIMSKVTKDEKYSYLIDAVAEEGTGITGKDVFAYFKMYRETKELKEKYEKQLARLDTFYRNFGKQFLVRGSDIDGLNMLNEGVPSKCILDTVPTFLASSDEEVASEDDDEDNYTPRGRKGRGRSNSGTAASTLPADEIRTRLMSSTLDQAFAVTECKFLKENTDDKPAVQVPIHAILHIFHLEKKDFHDVHVNNLKLYKYRKDLDDKLVLPEEVKTLSNMLVASVTDEDVEDVIEGKSQSVVITCIGAPGLGKTLLAEVLAESCEKPLYKVLADDLGLNSGELENNLSFILRQAERWNCILMIDEANAYVHERGYDIEQNALVGVFLRKLEYFKGVLVLTTNNTTIDGTSDIDDAILSRSSAVIEFKYPTIDESTKIWEVQAKMLKAEGPDWNAVAEKYPGLSGRAIRQLCRLAKNYATYIGAEKVSMRHIDICSKYIPKFKTEGKKNG